MVGYKMVVIFNEEASAWEPGLCVLDIPPSANVIIPGPEGPVRYMPADANTLAPQYDNVKMRCDTARVGAIYKIEGDHGTAHCGSVFNGCGYSSYEIGMLHNQYFYLLGRRINSRSSLKCAVLTTWLTSNQATIYKAGGLVTSPLDDVSKSPCAQGIHFFRSEKAALDWGLEESVPLFKAALRILNGLNYVPPKS